MVELIRPIRCPIWPCSVVLRITLYIHDFRAIRQTFIWGDFWPSVLLDLSRTKVPILATSGSQHFCKIERRVRRGEWQRGGEIPLSCRHRTFSVMYRFVLLPTFSKALACVFWQFLIAGTSPSVVVRTWFLSEICRHNYPWLVFMLMCLTAASLVQSFVTRPFNKSIVSVQQIETRETVTYCNGVSPFIANNRKIL